MKKLIIVLGKGQANLGVREYKVTNYALSSNLGNTIKTPFVGEAICKLLPNEFDEIHILGTQNSQWDKLFLRCYENILDSDEQKYKTFDQLTDKIKNENIVTELDISNVAEGFTDFVGVKTIAHLTEVGRSDEEIWKIFNTTIEIPNENDEISIDITHGLRFHPMFLTLAIFYFKLIKNIKINYAFYGALELIDTNTGITPIYNMKPLLEMIEWINAAHSFKNYFDIKPITELVKNESRLVKFSTFGQNLTDLLTLNSGGNIKTAAVRFRNTQDTINSCNINPLKFVASDIFAFPDILASNNFQYQNLIALANKYYEKGQYGLAILSAWESVMERFAFVFGNINIRENFDNWQNVTRNILELCRTEQNDAMFSRLFNKLKTLQDYRNAVAHSLGINQRKAITFLPIIFKLLTNDLQNAAIEKYKNSYKWLLDKPQQINKHK